MRFGPIILDKRKFTLNAPEMNPDLPLEIMLPKGLMKESQLIPFQCSVLYRAGWPY